MPRCAFTYSNLLPINRRYSIHPDFQPYNMEHILELEMLSTSKLHSSRRRSDKENHSTFDIGTALTYVLRPGTWDDSIILILSERFVSCSCVLFSSYVQTLQCLSCLLFPPALVVHQGRYMSQCGRCQRINKACLTIGHGCCKENLCHRKETQSCKRFISKKKSNRFKTKVLSKLCL